MPSRLVKGIAAVVVGAALAGGVDVGATSADAAHGTTPAMHVVPCSGPCRQGDQPTPGVHLDLSTVQGTRGVLYLNQPPPPHVVVNIKGPCSPRAIAEAKNKAAEMQTQLKPGESGGVDVSCVIYPAN